MAQDPAAKHTALSHIKQFPELSLPLSARLLCVHARWPRRTWSTCSTPTRGAVIMASRGSNRGPPARGGWNLICIRLAAATNFHERHVILKIEKAATGTDVRGRVRASFTLGPTRGTEAEASIDFAHALLEKII
jgi:hypothetical protein